MKPRDGQQDVRREVMHVVGWRGANGVEQRAVQRVFFSHEPNEPPHVHVDREICRRNSGFSLWHLHGISGFQRENCEGSEA